MVSACFAVCVVLAVPRGLRFERRGRRRVPVLPRGFLLQRPWSLDLLAVLGRPVPGRHQQDRLQDVLARLGCPLPGPVLLHALRSGTRPRLVGSPCGSFLTPLCAFSCSGLLCCGRRGGHVHSVHQGPLQRHGQQRGLSVLHRLPARPLCRPRGSVQLHALRSRLLPARHCISVVLGKRVLSQVCLRDIDSSCVCSQPCQAGFRQNITGSAACQGECSILYHDRARRFPVFTLPRPCHAAACTRGRFSLGAVESCEPCPVGYHQPGSQQVSTLSGLI